MSAIVSFLSESVVESLKGAYKLRKSYQLLHKMFDMIVSVEGAAQVDSSAAPTTRSTSSSPVDLSEDSEDEFVDATDNMADLVDSTLNNSEKVSLQLQASDSLNVRPSSSSTTPVTSSHSRPIETRPSISTLSSFQNIPTPPQLDLTFTDQTVYSGTLMALGAIMLLISLLPPSLSRLLSIIGFRGSRSQALSMLWKVSAFPTAFGGLATFGLGTYYGNIVQNCDIVGDNFTAQGSESGTTLERLYNTILSVRNRYPASALWVVEEVPLS
jgi:Protein of unknown function (DUF3808)